MSRAHMPPSYATGTRTDLALPIHARTCLSSCISKRGSSSLPLSSGSDSSTKAATLGSVSEMNVAHVGHPSAALADDVLLHEMREA